MYIFQDVLGKYDKNITPEPLYKTIDYKTFGYEAV